MTYGLILAAGIGERLEKGVPKALVVVNKKPIFIHSLLTFSKNKNIDKIIVVCHPKYLKSYEQLSNKFIKRKVYFCEGSIKGRQESLKNAIEFIKQNFKLNLDDIIVTHDCARTNVNDTVINDAIMLTKKVGYSTVAIKLNDSLFDLNKNCYINRDHKLLIQTPQSFQYKYWKNKPVGKSTDLFSYLNLKITKKNIVNGFCNNFKITNKEDLLTFNKVN